MENSENVPLEPVQNYLRLQHVLNYIALPLLHKIFFDKWKTKYQSEWKNSNKQGMKLIKSIGSSLFKDARKRQQNLLKKGDIEKWDVSLMIEVLKCFHKPTKNKPESDKGFNDQLKGFNELVDVRNHLSHHGGLGIDNKLFEELWNYTSEALVILGIAQVDLDKAKIVSERGKAHELIEEGSLHVENSEFGLAVKKYNEAISQPGLSSMELVVLHSNRSLANLKLGNYYKAKDDAMGTILLDPKSCRGFERLGRVYLSVDKYTQALENFEKAIELDPDCGLQNERERCRLIIEKVNRNEHLAPLFHVSTLRLFTTEMMNELNISPRSVKRINKMKDRDNFKRIYVGMCIEGHKYEQGVGVPKNIILAAQWFSKAALKGCAEGFYNLSFLIREGSYVNVDAVDESIHLMKLAASQDLYIDMFGEKAPNIGVVEAQYCLGLWYQYGVGVPQDSKKALEWYTRAIKHGNGLSAYNVGCMYSQGDVVPRDMEMALNYHKIGAAMKEIHAMERAADVYFKLFDKENARKWFQFAISEGSSYLQSQRQYFFALIGSELDTPIDEDLFKRELMEGVKNGPLKHLFGKELAPSPQDLIFKMLRTSKSSARCLTRLVDPYRIDIIRDHRAALRLHRIKALKYRKFEENLLPTPVVDLFTLKPIFFADMDPKKCHIYEKCAIKLTFIEDAITGRPAIYQIAEDEKGDARRISIYNFPQNGETQNKIGFGCKVTIVNPYIRFATDGRPMIRVDDISLMLLHSSKSNKTRCRYCGNECKVIELWPCKYCKRSYYCSKFCMRKDSMELYHTYVCVKHM